MKRIRQFLAETDLRDFMLCVMVFVQPFLGGFLGAWLALWMSGPATMVCP